MQILVKTSSIALTHQTVRTSTPSPLFWMWDSSSHELGLTLPCFYFKRYGNTLFNALPFFCPIYWKELKSYFVSDHVGDKRPSCSSLFASVIKLTSLDSLSPKGIIGILLWECGEKKATLHVSWIFAFFTFPFLGWSYLFILASSPSRAIFSN